MSTQPVKQPDSTPPHVEQRRRLGRFVRFCGCGFAALILIFCVCSGGIIALLSIAQNNETRQAERNRLPINPEATTLTLEIENTFGLIEVQESGDRDQTDIILEVERSGWGLTDNMARENRDAVSVDVSPTETGYRITVDMVSPSPGNGGLGFADLRIIVPRQRGVDNPVLYNFDIRNQAGIIDIERVEVADRMTLETTFGEVTFSGALQHPEGQYTISTRWGNILVDVTPRSSFQYRIEGPDIEVNTDRVSANQQEQGRAEGIFNGPSEAQLTIESQFGSIILRD